MRTTAQSMAVDRAAARLPAVALMALALMALALMAAVTVAAALMAAGGRPGPPRRGQFSAVPIPSAA